MTADTRPLRSADDREQELANLAAERGQLVERIAWLDALIEHLEAAGQPGTGARLGEYMRGRIPVKRRQQQAPGGPAGRVATGRGGGGSR